MFGLKPKLPVTPEERAWIEGAFERLQVLFGAETLRQVSVIAPKDEFFPEWDGTSACVVPLLRRVCGYLQADPESLTCELVEDRYDQLQRALPIFAHRKNRWTARSASDSYEPDSAEATVVPIKESLLPYPIALIGELAREVAQFRLLGEGLLSPDDPDAKPCIDLTTVLWGLGIFTANSSVRYELSKKGRSVSRSGYITQPQWGYALAEFARLRGEKNPAWARFLSDDIRTYFKSSHAILCREMR